MQHSLSDILKELNSMIMISSLLLGHSQAHFWEHMHDAV